MGAWPGSRQRSLLVVCTGNICRSPMAQRLLQQQLDEAGLGDWRVESRGVQAVVGHPATSEAMRAVQELGLDLKTHRGAQITAAEARAASLILTLEAWQRDVIRDRLLPTDPTKVQLLTHYDPKDPDRDIADPYGMSYRVYQGCRDEIRAAIRSVVHYVKELSA